MRGGELLSPRREGGTGIKGKKTPTPAPITRRRGQWSNTVWGKKDLDLYEIVV